MRRIIELRVHGVSGTPPEELLDRPLVRQVGGDQITGFYRPRLPSEALDEPYPPDPRDDKRVQAYLEGYAWGGLTSGAPSRALWLLMLPFALVNIAPRLRPPGLDGFRLGVLLYLSRLIALASTMMITLGVAGIGIGLFGWQCGGPRGYLCTSLPDWVQQLLWTLSPATRLLLGALVPGLFLFVLWRISRKTVERYEATSDPRLGRRRAEPGGGPDALDPKLADPWMWRGTHMVKRLRGLHMRGALLTIVLLLAVSIPDPTLRMGTAGPAAAVLAISLIALAIPTFVGRRDPDEKPEPGEPNEQVVRRRLLLINWVPWISWALTVVSVVVLAVAFWSGGIVQGWRSPAGLPGYDELLTALFFVQMLLVVGLIMVGRFARRDRFYGLATPFFATLGILLGAAFTAGIYVIAANWLSTGNTLPALSSAGSGMKLAVPTAMRVWAVAFGATLVVVVAAALAVGAGLLISRGRRRDPDQVVKMYGLTKPPPAQDETRIKQVQRIFWQAHLIDRADRVVAWLIGPATLAAIVVATINLFVKFGLWPAGWLVDGLRTGALLGTIVEWLYRLGAYAAAGLLVLLVLLGALVFRAGATRRSVGILWDLAGFWPRSVHPLAPPCYAERTVPDIKHRIRWWVTTGGDPEIRAHDVVLAGHSQGSVLGAAALLQLAAGDKVRTGVTEPPLLPHIAFLSYGCVLHRLYSSYFPAYFAEQTLATLARDLPGTGPLTGPRWRNLWRTSDYLGGPIQRDDAVDRRPLVDPTRKLDKHLIDPEFAVRPGELGYPRPHRHTGYSSDKEFQAAVRELAELLPAIDHRTSASHGQRRRRVSSTALVALRTTVIVGATFASARWWTVSRNGRSTGHHAPR